MTRGDQQELRAGGALVLCHPTVKNLDRNPRPSRRYLYECGEVRLLAEAAALEIRSYEESWGSTGKHEDYGSFLLYEDAGDGYGYEAGEFSTIDIQWHDTGRNLTIGARSGSYPGMPATRTFLVVLHHGPQATVDREVDYRGDPLGIDFDA